jgi:YD repeat-containing protein
VELFWYDDNGRRIRAFDPNGREREWRYYPSGHPSYGKLHEIVVDPGGLD